MVELRDIKKTFYPGTVNEFCLFDGFSLSVKKGEFVSVVGSNGSGKTTLLNLISGTLPIDGGQILLDGKDINRLPEYQRYRRIGRVFQDPGFGTVPDMTILENFSLAQNKGKPYSLSRAVNKKDGERFAEMLRPLGLGLEDKMNLPVGLLSGGQRQALSLIMSTLTPVDVLLLDEHTAALDPRTAEIIMQLTDQVVKEKNLTAIMVTHNLRYAVEYGSRLVMMDRGGIVVDYSGEQKQAATVDDLLDVFNRISIECGN